MTLQVPRRTVNIRLHRVQQDFRKSPELYRAFVGGRGAGKSWIGAYDILTRAIPGRSYLIGSPTGVLMGDTTFPTIKSIAENLGLWHSCKLTPYPNAVLSNGATLRFRTAEDPERMRGPNLSGVWLDEASLMHEDAYRICIAALREAGEQGWLSATFTPKGMSHWTYTTFATGKANTVLFRARTRDNPFNPPGFERTIAGQYPATFARQELGGEFVSVDGAWWGPEYFPSSIWFTEYPTDGLCGLVIAMDPALGKEAKDATAKKLGDYTAIVALVRGHDGAMYVEADLARRNDDATITRGIEFARKLKADTLQDVDGFGIESVAFQEVLANRFMQACRQAGVNLNVHKIGTGGVPKDVRIKRLSEWLASGRLKFRDTPGTRLLVQQFQEFPVGEHDDGPDALEMAKRLAEMLWEGKRR